MAYLPRKTPITIISPVFLMVVGCSTLQNNHPPKPPEPVSIPYDYHTDKKWLAAQAIMDSQFKDALKLQSWAEKVAHSTATNPVGAKKASKGMISDCALVSRLVKSKKAVEIFNQYMAAYDVQLHMNAQPSGEKAGIVDVAIEEAKANLDTALKNCQRHIK